MEPAQILIVDDDPEFLLMLVDILAKDGYRTLPCSSAEQALTALRRGPVDLVLADIRMPRLSGIDLLTRMRRMAVDADVILITAYASLETAVEALRLGAIDYLQKPFPSRVLRERVRQILQARRSRDVVATVIHQRDLTVDLHAHRLWIDGREVRLTRREYDVLAYLIRHRVRPVEAGELLQRVWGVEMPDQHSLDAVKACVYRLRKKMGDDARNPRYIANTRGIGYQFLY